MRSINTKDRDFFESLKNHESWAIQHLADRLTNFMPTIPSIYLLSKEDIEELRNDTLLITLKNLTRGTFQFQNLDPVTYALAVTRKLLANRLRKRGLKTEALEKQDVDSGFDPESYLLQKECELAIGKLLKELGPNCEQIIRLKYYHNLRDKEVVQKKLSAYATINALKSKRSQCLRKLADLVKEKGFSLTELLM